MTYDNNDNFYIYKNNNSSPTGSPRRRRRPGAAASAIPLVALGAILVTVVCTAGAGDVASWGPVALLTASAVSIATALFTHSLSPRALWIGLVRSSRQILPAVPILACIGLLASTWMLSGIVPLMISYGLDLLSAELFLPATAAVCAVVSVMLGSSWATIATVGVAFMGIGTALGYGEAWIAGAIISGAYFGDKVSPLSDTTVVASSACGVDLFAHIRNLMATSMPAMSLSLLIFGIAGWDMARSVATHASEVTAGLAAMFNLTPCLLVVPAIVAIMCVCKAGSLRILLVGGIAGTVAVFVFQPHIAAMIMGDEPVAGILRMIFLSTSTASADPLLGRLVETSGIAGMLPTIALVISAMIFGGVLMGTGQLAAITASITRRLRRRGSLVATTVASGLSLNAITSDQYLSIIIGSNVYRSAYRRTGCEPRLLSRTLEDSVSVTSVLIPWNSCGITQSTVLGVATVTYLPFCFFNWLSPLFTLLLATVGGKAKRGIAVVGRGLLRYVPRLAS